MGTNYYLQFPDTNICPHCGRRDEGERLHVGKSSGGWCFSLHVIPERGIEDLKDWEPFFLQGDIWDEYGEKVPVEEMRQIITSRGRKRPMDYPNRWYRSEKEMLERNGAELGPNGLLRHRVGRSCVRHGDGTWDCIEGEFS